MFEGFSGREIGVAAALEQAAELVGARGAREGDVGRDHPAQRQVGERLLHRLHPARGAGLHDGVDLLDLRLADQVPNRVVGDQDLECRRAPGAVGGRDEVLRHDSLERAGELDPNLVLLLGGKGVDDAVDRLRRALGVQRREDEVAGLGCGQRGADRLEVAHLADEDHVRVLPQRRAERVGEGARVGADLALVDDAALVPVQELDRVLDREDVLVPRRVDPVEQRRERGRLARARRARDEDQAARLVGEVVEARRHPELLERLDLLRDQPEGGADARALEVGVDTEAREAGDRIGEVELTLRLEELLLLGRADPVDERARVVGQQLREVREALEAAVDPDHGRRAGREVQVGRVLLDHDGEQVVDRMKFVATVTFPFDIRRLELELVLARDAA